MSDHARLAPSNTRWPHCAGSVREEEKYPDIPGEAAIDGTGSHLLLEMCLNQGVAAETFDRQIIGANHEDSPNGWLVDDERCARVQECLDYVTRRLKELQEQFPGHNIRFEAEARTDAGALFGRTDWWGTCDITLIVTNDHNKCLFLEVIDYKDGRLFVPVNNDEYTFNTQLLSYLTGKAREWIANETLMTSLNPKLLGTIEFQKIKNTRMTIVQPKTNPSVRYLDTGPSQLIGPVTLLLDAANRTDDPNAPLTPDNKGGKGWCRWCKHRDDCNALTNKSLGVLDTMTTAIQPTQQGNVPTLDVTALAGVLQDIQNAPADRLVSIADTRAGLMAMYKKLDEEIERRLVAGEIVNGYEMQQASGSNVWAQNEAATVKLLKARRLVQADYYPKNLISPAACLKLDKLNKDQKARISKDMIAYVASDSKKLTRVAFKTQNEGLFDSIIVDNETAVENTLGFDDLPKQPETTKAKEISFL